LPMPIETPMSQLHSTMYSGDVCATNLQRVRELLQRHTNKGYYLESTSQALERVFCIMCMSPGMTSGTGGPYAKMDFRYLICFVNC